MKSPIRCKSLFFCTLTILLGAHGRAQSNADVHIVPRSTVTKGRLDIHSSGPSEYPESKSIKVNVNLVLVPVTVRDAKDRPVMQLSRQDFALYEDQIQQEIRYFSSESEPISIAVLLDVSKSMSDKINTERAALVQFFDNADPQDEYFAFTFSDKPRLLVGPTQSADDVLDKLTGVQPSGPTAMLDAVYLAQQQLRSAHYKRKAIFIISDGGDNVSRYTLRQIKKLAQESDVQIYAIGLFETFFFNTIEERLGKKWLSEITDATGGRTVTVDSGDKLPAAAAEISREMRNEYLLGYRPSGTVPNRWRKIKVKVLNSFPADQPLRASYRKGYLTAE